MALGDQVLSNHVAVGSVDGTGSAITIVCGFKPLSIRVHNIDGDVIAFWDAIMPDAAMQKIVDSGAGTTDISYVTSNGITPAFNGFTIGTDSDLNVSAEELHWVA